MERQFGNDVVRKEARDKVIGIAKYTNDLVYSPVLHNKILASLYAYMRII